MEVLQKDKIFILSVYLIYLVGSIAFQVDTLKGLMIGLTPFVLLLTGCFVLGLYPTNKRYEFLRWVVFSFIFVSLIEIIGIKTGYVFGDYRYSGLLGFKVMGFPLIIALNWILITLGGIALLDKLKCNNILKSLFVGLIAVVFDYFLEPVAMRLNFWTWNGGSVPVQNYSAWLIIVSLSAYGFYRSRLSGSYNPAAHHLLAQSMFFVILSVS